MNYMRLKKLYAIQMSASGGLNMHTKINTMLVNCSSVISANLNKLINKVKV